MIEQAVSSLRSREHDRKATEGGRILVVDDNEINRDVLSRRLVRQGYTPLTAQNGREAIEMLRTEAFDLVLLDILMPEMNGYEALEQLKADPVLRHIPVIMISALDEIESVVRCIEIGAEDYLPKPFNPVVLRARIGASLEKKRLRDREVLYLRQIEEEKKRSDELLHVILPHDIVKELKANGFVAPRRHQDVAVLFCDIVGFTPYSATRQPEEIVAALQLLFEAYEELAAQYQMYKIKTIGDSFMSTAGLLVPVPNPVLAAVRCGLEMVTTARHLPAGWDVRVGIHAGPVVAGVVGRKQYLYDLWGDTVNTAARVESHGSKAGVNVSASAWERIKDECEGRSLGLIPVKGKGEMEIFRVEALR
ncbi:MAG TPA: adenylate/guanylate cyclase domain-containing protein [Vicinamibacteria bacterium]|nr:adenylate/guanylate cyclase domain-containing protein [Vicinamibacteria bacterium]